MNLTPEDLPASGFVRLETLNHSELVPFVQRALKLRTVSTLTYIAINAALVIAAAVGFAVGHTRGISVDQSLNRLAFGIVATVVLIPIHEWVHVLAYRAVGARRTAIEANLRQFVFVAIADRFVASSRELIIVALAPFIIISTLLLGAALWLPLQLVPFVVGALLSHTACCSGDFALVSWFEANRASAPVTFDDRGRGLTEFWGLRVSDADAVHGGVSSLEKAPPSPKR